MKTRCKCSVVQQRKGANGKPEKRLVGKVSCKLCRGTGATRRCVTCQGAGLFPDAQLCKTCGARGCLPAEPTGWRAA